MNKNTAPAAHIPHITKQALFCGRTQEFLTTYHNILTVNHFYPKQSIKMPSSAGRKGDMERQKRLYDSTKKAFRTYGKAVSGKQETHGTALSE